jgi:hypothetical protein
LNVFQEQVHHEVFSQRLVIEVLKQKATVAVIEIGDTFDRKAFVLKQVNKSSSTSTPHIQCFAFVFNKTDGTLMSLNAVISIEFFTLPKVGDRVIGFADI